ncbi:hypothetical protein [Falsiroseomonas sp. CW058]|uniref:hypothetical protein n=1 Tax=Falsiroseomonas sp. CW058 TaxID=3388664 RepID=UPI003D31AF5E
MQPRRFLLAGLAGALAAAFAAPEAGAEEFREEAQYGGGRRRRRRCWIETRRVPFRDRWGRVRYRLVEREVCRR